MHGSRREFLISTAGVAAASAFPWDRRLLIYSGGSHSLGDTSKEQFNEDLLEFAKA